MPLSITNHFASGTEIGIKIAVNFCYGAVRPSIMFHELSTLEIVLIFLAAAVGVVALARKLHLPPILGYLIAGILVGPHALGFVPDTPGTRYLGEFGVVFLMFSIGLEFNLAKLISMRATVFGFGLAQVGLTALLGVAAAAFMGLGWQAGLALGGALAMSSTAIVVKLLAERL